MLGIFDNADIYRLDTSSYPDKDFSLSEPALYKLASDLKNTYTNKSDNYI